MFFVKLLLRKLFLINWYISEKQSSKIKTEMTSTANNTVCTCFSMRFFLKILKFTQNVIISRIQNKCCSMPKKFKSQNRHFLGGLEPFDYLKFCKMYFFHMKFDFI